MLRGWPIALVAAAGASAVFAFGIVQSAFAPQAQALFIVFAAVLLLLLAADKFFGDEHGRAGRGHGDRAVVMSGRMVGAVTVLAALLAVAFFWTDNRMSAEKIGRHIDRGAASLGRQAQFTLTRLTGRPAEDAGAQKQQPPAPPPPQDG